VKTKYKQYNRHSTSHAHCTITTLDRWHYRSSWLFIAQLISFGWSTNKPISYQLSQFKLQPNCHRRLFDVLSLTFDADTGFPLNLTNEIPWPRLELLSTFSWPRSNLFHDPSQMQQLLLSNFQSALPPLTPTPFHHHSVVYRYSILHQFRPTFNGIVSRQLPINTCNCFPIIL